MDRGREREGERERGRESERWIEGEREGERVILVVLTVCGSASHTSKQLKGP